MKKCLNCNKKVELNDTFHTIDKKKPVCFKCINKALKEGRCILCDNLVKNKFFSYFFVKKKHKFLCIDCVKGIKKINVTNK